MQKRTQRGFTLTELLIATAILLFGVVSIVQLVPNAMQANLRNRYDSTAVVMAERYLDQMLSQPLSATQFTNADGVVMNLGGVAGFAGSPLATMNLAGGQVNVLINFQANPVAGYNLVYADPNDPSGVRYEVRWAVTTDVLGPTVVAKRFFVGVWKRDPRVVLPPVTLEAWVQR